MDSKTRRPEGEGLQGKSYCTSIGGDAETERDGKVKKMERR